MTNTEKLTPNKTLKRLLKNNNNIYEEIFETANGCYIYDKQYRTKCGRRINAHYFAVDISGEGGTMRVKRNDFLEMSLWESTKPIYKEDYILD